MWRNERLTLIAAAVLWAAGPARAQTGSVVVDGRSSVFTQSGFGGSTDGSALAGTRIALSPGTGRTLMLPSVSGNVHPAHSPHGADGGYYQGETVNLNSIGALSGVLDDQDHTLALMGVFLSTNLGGGEPQALRLDFSGNHAFTHLSPQLNQTFFLGDGLTGTGAGALQQFAVPDGAAYLQLGFADGYNGTAFQGDPSFYYDNGGALTVQFDVTASGSGAAAVPEPGALALFLPALGVVAVLRRRRDP